MVIATSIMGISSAITFAKKMWNGQDMEHSLELTAYEGIKAGGLAFVSAVVTAQLVRTSLNSVLLAPSIALVKILPSNCSPNFSQFNVYRRTHFGYVS